MTKQELLLIAKTTRATEHLYFLESQGVYWYSTIIRDKPITFIETPKGDVIAAYHNSICYILEKPDRETSKLITKLNKNIFTNCIVRLYNSRVAFSDCDGYVLRDEQSAADYSDVIPIASGTNSTVVVYHDRTSVSDCDEEDY